MTCPHFNSIGGLSGFVTSLETGHTKNEWYLYSLPISISIGMSLLITSDERSIYLYIILRVT